MLTGLDEYYKNWKIRETQTLSFISEDSINENEIERITKTRQIAFEQINAFLILNCQKNRFFCFGHCVGGSNNQKVRRPGLAAPIPVNTGQRGR